MILDDHPRIALGAVFGSRHTADHALLVDAGVDQMIAHRHRTVVGAPARFAELGRADHAGDDDLALLRLDLLDPLADADVERLAALFAELGGFFFKVQHHCLVAAFDRQTGRDFLGFFDAHLDIVVAAAAGVAAQTAGVGLQWRCRLRGLELGDFALQLVDLIGLVAVLAFQARGVGVFAFRRIDLVRLDFGGARLGLHHAFGDHLADADFRQLLRIVEERHDEHYHHEDHYQDDVGQRIHKTWPEILFFSPVHRFPNLPYLPSGEWLLPALLPVLLPDFAGGVQARPVLRKI